MESGAGGSGPDSSKFFRRQRGISSAGRAPGLQPGGHRFDPGILHQRLIPNAFFRRRAGRKDPERIPRFFDNRSGKVAKALGET